MVIIVAHGTICRIFIGVFLPDMYVNYFVYMVYLWHLMAIDSVGVQWDMYLQCISHICSGPYDSMVNCSLQSMYGDYSYQ